MKPLKPFTDDFEKEVLERVEMFSYMMPDDECKKLYELAYRLINMDEAEKKAYEAGVPLRDILA